MSDMGERSFRIVETGVDLGGYRVDPSDEFAVGPASPCEGACGCYAFTRLVSTLGVAREGRCERHMREHRRTQKGVVSVLGRLQGGPKALVRFGGLVEVEELQAA